MHRALERGVRINCIVCTMSTTKISVLNNKVSQILIVTDILVHTYSGHLVHVYCMNVCMHIPSTVFIFTLQFIQHPPTSLTWSDSVKNMQSKSQDPDWMRRLASCEVATGKLALFGRFSNSITSKKGRPDTFLWYSQQQYSMVYSIVELSTE